MRLILPVTLCLLMLISCSQEQGSSKTIEPPTPTIDEMIGQMIMIGFRGFNFDEVSENVKSSIKEGNVGGIVLFDYDVINKEAKRNISSSEQVRKLINDLQNLAPTPLLTAVDQEGGRVNRLKEKYGFPKSVSNQYLGTLDNLDSTRFYAEQNAHLLYDLGFNVNFAPAVDLNANPENPVIGKIERSYGPSSEKVIKHATAWIKAHQQHNVISTLKHFPGHGSSDQDSHYGLTDITKSWSREELKPFEVLTREEAVAVMTAHVVNHNLDSLPATLSPQIIKKILREDWNFDGLIFSDDLHMAAVNELYTQKEILLQSILAGVDILVYGNNLKYDESIPKKVISTIKELIEEGLLDENRVRQSYERIMKVKEGI